MGREHICGSGDGVCARCYPIERDDGYPDRTAGWTSIGIHYDGGLSRYVATVTTHRVVGVVDTYEDAQQLTEASPSSELRGEGLMTERDPAGDAAKADAARTNCCANGEWRGHFCQYHQGFEDGYDAALAAAPAENPDRWR